MSTFRSGSVTHTASANAWWKVTLKERSYISYIDIYNRMDCCQERLKNARVSVDGSLIGTIKVVEGTPNYRLPVDKNGNGTTFRLQISAYFIPFYILIENQETSYFTMLNCEQMLKVYDNCIYLVPLTPSLSTRKVTSRPKAVWQIKSYPYLGNL